MILDVGCGNNPRGDVNCDLYIVNSNGDRQTGDTLSAKTIPNLVNCDGHQLPFKDQSFDSVFCAQVIEHTIDPFSFLRELSRVSSYNVIVETVHRYGEALNWHNHRWYRTHHVSHFNKAWFVKAAKALGLAVKDVKVLSWMGFPFPYFEIIKFPFELRVEMVKNE